MGLFGPPLNTPLSGKRTKKRGLSVSVFKSLGSLSVVVGAVDPVAVLSDRPRSTPPPDRVNDVADGVGAGGSTDLMMITCPPAADHCPTDAPGHEDYHSHA